MMKSLYFLSQENLLVILTLRHLLAQFQQKAGLAQANERPQRDKMAWDGWAELRREKLQTLGEQRLVSSFYHSSSPSLND